MSTTTSNGQSNGHTNGNTNGNANGNTNGHINDSSSMTQTSTNGSTTSSSKEATVTRIHKENSQDTHSSRTDNSALKSSSVAQKFTSDQQVSVLRQTVTITRTKFISELTRVDASYIDSMSMESFLDFIECERLTYMPQRGSRWDKVLKWAEFFALQISGYENAVSPFVPQSKSATKLIWTACRVLIELGPSNAQAIETVFAVLYKLGLSLSFFLQHHELLSSSSNIRTEVGEAFNDLLLLVRDIALHYYVQINSLSTNEISLDFNSLFGRNIEAFYGRKDRIIEAMWVYTINDDSINIWAIGMWLSVRDRTTRTFLTDRAAAKARRDEYTCEWFQRHLLDFSRSSDDVLAITGPSGSGKSMLSGWILERLQRPIGRRTYQTISLSIDPELPNECTTLAIAKDLALQLLKSNIGDIALLRALEKVHSSSLGSCTTDEIETGLWKAIHIGVKYSKAESLAIIVDGLDERCGAQMASKLSAKIWDLASKHKNVQAIILARNATHVAIEKTSVLAITPDHTYFDIQRIAEHALRGCQHFLNQNDLEQEAIVEKLSHASKGDFLWVQLMAKALTQETSHDGFTKAVKAAKEAPKTTEQLLRNLATGITADFSKPETNLILSWLLAAERPLTVAEIKSLLLIDLQKKTLVSRNSDATEDIRMACGPLIRIQNGIVRFRHGALREELLKICAEGKKLRHLPIIQGELATRLLAYCKFRLTSQYAVGFEHPEAGVIGGLSNDALLEYAARNWIIHFKNSPFYKSSGTFEFHADFKSVFPSSVQLAIFEWSCWEAQTSTRIAASLHDLAFRIRHDVFTEKHESVLQTLIVCGHLQRKLLKMEEAGNYFYRASRLGQSILKSYSSVTTSCTTAYLEITETATYTSRTELVTRREEMLQYTISAYTQQFGKSSEIVIRYQKILAELYISIHEEKKSESIWKTLRDTIITRYGEGSSEETSISGRLKVILKKGETRDEIIEYERDIFETTSELEIWDIQRIKVTLKLAATYESHGDILSAEEIYVTLWGGLIEHCHQVESHHHVDIEVHVSMIDIALEYVRFLRRYERHEEAAGILICIWAEYEEYEFESEIIFLRLKIVGELMRVTSLLSVAVSVFKKCWSWFKSHGKVEHTSSCQTLISETIEEIITTTKTTSVSTSTTTSTSTETVIKEIFESSISKTTLTSETVSICRSFISLYMKTEQWSEAITASTRSLEIIWKLIVSGRGTVALPREFASEAIEIAIQLAVCYHRSHLFHEAESVYLRIYRACFNSCNVHDERMTKAYTLLIAFYEEHHQWNKVIEIYQEVLSASRKHLGATHSLTIKTLYILGSLCADHGHGSAHKYYEEIITVLNSGSKLCHQDSMVAMKIMCRIYYEQGQWQQLRANCEFLWETWVHHHEKHKLDAEFIELLYTRYIYVLEHHGLVEYEIIREITIQYRDVCVKVFGASVAITVKALIELAQICMRSEKYTHEAISYYEEVIKITTTSTKTTTTTTTIVSTSTISKVKQLLTKAYIHVCSHGSASSTTVERAILVLTERFEYLKITFGCAHTETLTVLRELILLYKKQKTALSVVTKLLLDTTIVIISKEKNSRVLYEAAKTMGNLYLICGLVEEGRRMLAEMHRQIVFKTATDKCSFKIDHSVGKSSYVFIVTFEEFLQGSESISYSKIIADLLTETILYESYLRCVKSEKNIEVVMWAGARLYVFLEKSSRKEQLIILQEDIHKVFIKKWGASIKTRHEISIIFVINLLRILGQESRQIKIGDAASRSSNIAVRELLYDGDVSKAYEVALCAFQFAEQQGTYHHLQNVGHGFKLSALMACRGVTLEKPIEPELHAKMLELSRKIISDVLKACKDYKINFVRLKLSELNDLVGLLGDQQNYADLEWLLNSLWSSREVQKNWSGSIIVAIGRRLVQARFLGSHSSDAIKLCEAICYNLRRVYGSLDAKALEMSELLSQTYTATGRHREAMRVHEEILRLVVEGDDADDRTQDNLTAQVAKHHLMKLKETYLRLKGWDKKASVYKDLVDQLLAMPEYKNDPLFKGIQSTDTWTLKDKLEGSGKLEPVKNWEFADRKTLSEKGDIVETGSIKSQRQGLKRITSNWGIDIGLLGQNDFDDESEKSKPDILVKLPDFRPTKTPKYTMV